MDKVGIAANARDPAPVRPPSIQTMPLSGRHDDPILEQIARDTFALFPHCHLCGQQIEKFEDADIRVHVQRVVHRGACPPPAVVERLIPPETAG